MCDESQDEYTGVDPVYINMKFPGEVPNRFFITHILNLCIAQVWILSLFTEDFFLGISKFSIPACFGFFSQREELMKEDQRAKGRAQEHESVVKERNVLKELLNLYIRDSPYQAKIDIVEWVIFEGFRIFGSIRGLWSYNRGLDWLIE